MMLLAGDIFEFYKVQGFARICKVQGFATCMQGFARFCKVDTRRWKEGESIRGRSEATSHYLKVSLSTYLQANIFKLILSKYIQERICPKTLNDKYFLSIFKQILSK